MFYPQKTLSKSQFDAMYWVLTLQDKKKIYMPDQYHYSLLITLGYVFSLYVTQIMGQAEKPEWIHTRFTSGLVVLLSYMCNICDSLSFLLLTFKCNCEQNVTNRLIWILNPMSYFKKNYTLHWYKSNFSDLWQVMYLADYGEWITVLVNV